MIDFDPDDLDLSPAQTAVLARVTSSVVAAAWALQDLGFCSEHAGAIILQSIRKGLDVAQLDLERQLDQLDQEDPR
jgi:hypothetical protein